MEAPPQKPKLAQVLNQHQVTMIRLAQVARVQRGTVYAMVTGFEVSSSLAEQVLNSLTKLVGTPYNLENVEIAVYQERGGGS